MTQKIRIRNYVLIFISVLSFDERMKIKIHKFVVFLLTWVLCNNISNVNPTMFNNFRVKRHFSFGEL